jgi:hypothetical protein
MTLYELHMPTKFGQQPVPAWCMTLQITFSVVWPKWLHELAPKHFDVCSVAIMSVLTTRQVLATKHPPQQGHA